MKRAIPRRGPFRSVPLFALVFLLIVGSGTVAGFLLGRRGVPIVEQAFLQDFDLCGFATKGACQADAGCAATGYPASCYLLTESNEWCCPLGCTIEEVCGDVQIERNGILPDEECDPGGTCTVGGLCTTVESVQRCVAKGGTCTPVANAWCTATCQNVNALCGNGTCQAALNENCLTCASDCACGKGKTCILSGQCVKNGTGQPRCGNGTVNAGEQCDDGNTVNGDGCSSVCSCEACGDGYKCVTEQCDDGNSVDTDACSNACVIRRTCSDGKKNQGETQTDCGGPCPPCLCTSSAQCNDGLYCTVDACSGGVCQYTAFDGGPNTNPCLSDYPKICANPAHCTCNEATNRCDLCKNPGGSPFVTLTQCKTTSNTLCQDHGNPTGCFDKNPPNGPWCCPGRE